MVGHFKVTTLGCQMNKSDSERLCSILTKAGLHPTENESGADLLIYNTCAVRQKAEDRVYGIHHTFAKLKTKNPKLIIAVTGCMAGRDHDGKIRERLPDVDLFFPIEEMVHLPRRVSELNPSLIVSVGSKESEYEHYLNIAPSYDNPFQAYLIISNGCNKFCAYCVVPYARGRQKDRPVSDVLAEARALSERGCKEITILGQCVNLYSPPDKGYFPADNLFAHSKNCFAALMWELNKIDGIERINFTAPHPQYMDEQTITCLAMPKNVNYIHLPVQAGSNAILMRMNRPYSREYYIDTIQQIRAAKPGIAIGTDIIVGFCGETEQDFEETVSLYRQCDFDIAYIAQYSVRSGTAAARLYKDDVPAKEKKRRRNVLQRMMEKTVFRKNQEYVGKTVSVLVENCDKKLCSGNSREMKRILFRGDESLVGTIQDITIVRSLEWILYGSK